MVAAPLIRVRPADTESDERAGRVDPDDDDSGGLGRRLRPLAIDTLAVNVVGSFLLGGLIAAPVGQSVLLVVGTGFCGALTTFSTFAFETVRLAETGYSRAALGNAAVNLAGAVAAVLVGGAVVGGML